MARASLLNELRVYLLGIAEITEIVGDRISQEFADEQETWPYVIYGRRGLTENRELLDDPSTIIHQIDLECRGASMAETEQLMLAVRAALHLFRGAWGPFEIQIAYVDDVTDSYELLRPTNENEYVSEFSTRIHTNSA